MQSSTILVAPYRETVSAIPPYCALWGFWCLNMANWVRYPSPFLGVSPLESMRSGGAIPPPTKGVSQRYLSNTTRKQGKWVLYPPLRYDLEKVLRDMGGISHWAAKSTIVDKKRAIWNAER